MKCPICGARLVPGSDRCPSCGYLCRSTYTPPTETASPTPSRSSYTPPNKSKKSACCCCCLGAILPLVILLVVAAFSITERAFEEFVLPEFEIFEDVPFEDFPSEELIPESLPEAADEGCFAAAEHTVMFLPEHWDGEPILRIPDSIGGEEITTIGPGCFMDCTGLTTIVLPDSVTAIGARAFSGCTDLRGLYLPEGTESIGPEAFAGCINMEAIYIPATVTHIAEGCFDDCASLLYIFYEGPFDGWDALCDDYINPFTTAICLDGSYYHGAED